MWEPVAVRFNANRARGTPERDIESLCRKFKNLYAKPKPSEAEGGAHTSHDGLDDGEDDENFERDIEVASTEQGPILRSLGDDEDDLPAHQEEDTTGCPVEVHGVGDTGDLNESTVEEPTHGTIVTERYGSIDAALAGDYALSDDEAIGGEGTNTDDVAPLPHADQDAQAREDVGIDGSELRRKNVVVVKREKNEQRLRELSVLREISYDDRRLKMQGDTDIKILFLHEKNERNCEE
ncbi:hypothetical protein PHMEG_00021046 [Phytophthora megakarya]|uniref:DUF6818 domain-containing protein n=1 Tax=Phytophthora megakarya TaxID=4795 RepID=A0A225VMC7_9STRA|nr:hypothetical protein PHMEG_00021046 [Phytophthora megakarya]